MIYDKSRMNCRTFVQQLNNLFKMGSELEQRVYDGEQVAEGVSVTAQDGYYLLHVDDASTSAKLIDNQTYYSLIIGVA